MGPKSKLVLLPCTPLFCLLSGLNVFSLIAATGCSFFLRLPGRESNLGLAGLRLSSRLHLGARDLRQIAGAVGALLKTGLMGGGVHGRSGNTSHLCSMRPVSKEGEKQSQAYLQQLNKDSFWSGMASPLSCTLVARLNHLLCSLEAVC